MKHILLALFPLFFALSAFGQEEMKGLLERVSELEQQVAVLTGQMERVHSSAEEAIKNPERGILFGVLEYTNPSRDARYSFTNIFSGTAIYGSSQRLKKRSPNFSPSVVGSGPHVDTKISWMHQGGELKADDPGLRDATFRVMIFSGYRGTVNFEKSHGHLNARVLGEKIPFSKNFKVDIGHLGHSSSAGTIAYASYSAFLVAIRNDESKVHIKELK